MIRDVMYIIHFNWTLI